MANPEHPKRYFTVHLQKTAGTTLRDRLRNSLKPREIYPHMSDGPNILSAIITLSHLEKRWKKRSHEIRLVHGHFPLSTINVLRVPFTTMSVLRPPLERTLSYLRHQREVVPSNCCASAALVRNQKMKFWIGINLKDCRDKPRQ